AAERLRAAMTESVRLRLQSEVPLGAFLSGGVDSAIVCALMRQASNSAVRTFTIGFGDALYDESAEAAATARHLGTEHATLRVEPQAVDILPKLAWHYDEPFADSSALPTWYLAEMTRRHVTVALSGDGGDELFLGYPRYRAVALGAAFDRLPKLLRKAIGSSLWQRLPAPANRRSRLHRAKKLLAALPLSPARRYLEWIAIFTETQRAELYTDDFLASLPDSDPAEFVIDAWRRAAAVARGAPAVAGLTDLITYLPGDLMTKVDLATMAHGLECRQPFLDHRVVELAVSMPAHYRFRRGRGKHILRAAFGDLLPASLFARRKRGFGVPLARWFREDLASFTKEILLDEQTTARGYLRRDAVTRLLEEHATGRAEHGDRLWALLMLELWMREWSS
ncbi:MAG: asparagine synthase C-terminal domain-containing protein, partial [Pirellulales bacterium]